jgi:hypothetical protein
MLVAESKLTSLDIMLVAESKLTLLDIMLVAYDILLTVPSGAVQQNLKRIDALRRTGFSFAGKWCLASGRVNQK